MDPEDENLTSHALVLYLRGICMDLKYSLAYFTTKRVKITWKNCGELHGKGERDICYQTYRNLFAPARFIFFFTDAPQLIKTAENCLHHSGSRRCNRYVWNDGKYLL